MIVEPQLDVLKPDSPEKGEDALYEKFSNWENRFLVINEAQAGFEAGEFITIIRVDKSPTGRTRVWFEDQFGTIDFFFPKAGDFDGIEPEKPVNEVTQTYLPDEATLGFKDLLTNKESFYLDFTDGKDKGVEAIFDVLHQNDILKAITNDSNANSSGKRPHHIAFGNSQATSNQGPLSDVMVIKHHHNYSINPPNLEKPSKRYTGTNETRLLELLYRAATTEENPTDQDKKILELWSNMMPIAIERAKLLERRTKLIPREIMDEVDQLDLAKDSRGLSKIGKKLEKPINSLLWNLSHMPATAYIAATYPEVCEQLFGTKLSDFDEQWLRETPVLNSTEIQEAKIKTYDKKTNLQKARQLIKDVTGTSPRSELDSPIIRNEIAETQKLIKSRLAHMPSSLANLKYQKDVLHESPTIKSQTTQYPRFSEKGINTNLNNHPILGNVAVSITNEKRFAIKSENSKPIQLSYSPAVMKPFIGTTNMPNTQIQFYVADDGTTMGYEIFAPSTDNKIPPINQQILDFLMQNNSQQNKITPRGRLYRNLDAEGLTVKSGKHFLSIRLGGEKLDRNNLADQLRDPATATEWKKKNLHMGSLATLEQLGLLDISSIKPEMQDSYNKLLATRNFGSNSS